MSLSRRWWETTSRTSASRLASRLADSIGLVPGAPVAVERTYLDSFDWKLFKRGDVLFEERSTGGGADRLDLVLRDQDGARELRVPSAGGARQSWELPDATRRRLGRDVAERRLVEVGREKATVWPLPMVDDDGKTLAVVRVEKSGSTVRVVLEPRKGYEREASRLAAILEGQADLVPSEEPVVAAVHAAGGVPGVRLQPPAVQLGASDRAGTALLAVFEHQVLAMEAYEDGVRADLDPEVLHRFRVAIRRTRSIERLTRTRLPAEVARLWEQDWRWLAAVTGTPRDLDVLVLDLRLEYERWDGVPRDGLAELSDRAVALLARHQAVVREALDSDRYRTLKDGWRTSLVAGTKLLDEDGTSARELARDTMVRAEKQLRKAVKAAKDDSPSSVIHDVRKRVKRLRYAAELLGSALPAKEVRSVVSTTKELQDALGRFQDAQVQQTLLREVLDDAASAPASASAADAVDAILQHLAAAQHEARRSVLAALRRWHET